MHSGHTSTEYAPMKTNQQVVWGRWSTHDKREYGQQQGEQPKLLVIGIQYLELG